jgi:hypothetical protein
MATSDATTRVIVERRTLPLGVAVISVLVGILGVFLLIAGLVLLVYGAAGALEGLAFFGGSIVGAVFLLILAVVLLAVATGLWDLELWALVLSIIVVGGLWILEILAGHFVSIGSLVLFVLLVYLVAVHRNFV